MKVHEVMTRDVRVAAPTQSIRDAAKLMSGIDVGAVPVRDAGRLVGIITDRDIAVRGVAAGMLPETPIARIMSSDLSYCYDDQEVEEVAHSMSGLKVRRLLVLDRRERLVGIVSLGDLATKHNGSMAGNALAGVSIPGGAHSQDRADR